jgi:hypothetical protein
MIARRRWYFPGRALKIPSRLTQQVPCHGRMTSESYQLATALGGGAKGSVKGQPLFWLPHPFRGLFPDNTGLPHLNDKLPPADLQRVFRAASAIADGLYWSSSGCTQT